MKLVGTAAIAALGIFTGLAGAAPANATAFAIFSPVDTTDNIALSGTTLAATAPVTFNFLDSALSPLGTLGANLVLSATETSAAPFGPLVLGTFDGSFNLTYNGASSVSAGGYTVNPGDTLLSGTFASSVFTGYGTSGSLVDSVLGGGVVAFNNNKFVSFTPGLDESLAIGMVSFSNPVAVVNGLITPFMASASGNFAADGYTDNGGGGVPEPSSWALMLIGFGLVGLTARRRGSIAA